MKFDPYKHHRRSIRLKEYDYAQPGWYFITVCSFNREFLFGNITDQQMILNAYGRIVEKEWIKTSKIRNNVFIDEYIIMPNHIHGIIVINNVGAHCNVPLPNTNHAGRFEQFGKSSKNSIPTIIKIFKSVVTKNINKIRNAPGLPVWQRNYYACPDEYRGTCNTK